MLVAVVLLTVAFPASAAAHPARLVAATASVDASGSFRVRLRFDLLALALNDTPDSVADDSMNQLLDGPDDVLARHIDDARQRLLHGVIFVCGDQRTIVRGDAIACTSANEVMQFRNDDRRIRLPIVGEATISGRLPAGTASVAIRLPEVLGPVVLTVERPGEEPYAEPVEPGRTSSTLPVRLTAPENKGDISHFPSVAASDHTTLTGAAVSTPALGEKSDVPFFRTRLPTTSRNLSAEPSQLRAAAKYLALGFEHIVPRGPDHMLFVLGLFLLSTKVRPLLWQVTAFTVAHSITLALSLYGAVRLPGQIVEPLIAASIAFVAVENLFTSDLKPWRPFVVFGFGLVHGLGFAGALTDAGLPRPQFAAAVVTFNVGVELGQLAVIAAAFAAVGWWRRRTWYRGLIVVPASCAIALVAMLWTVQRILADHV